MPTIHRTRARGSRGNRDLTAREKDILRELAKGRTNREIADTCGISEQTVKNHISYIMLKLHVVNRTEAAVLALTTSLLEPTPQVQHTNQNGTNQHNARTATFPKN